MQTVRDILKKKGSETHAVSPDTSVYDALKLMAEKNIGAVLVLEAGRPVGILSERDYARQVILKGKTSKDTPVREIMTSRVVFVRPEQSVEECMALMTDKRIRHLPVLDAGHADRHRLRRRRRQGGDLRQAVPHRAAGELHQRRLRRRRTVDHERDKGPVRSWRTSPLRVS